MSQTSNSRVAKNAIMLTIRMIIVTLVGLYTSRVVFAQLGDENYGIYGVVGGILGFMSFLTTSMAGASSRFITYEIGRGNNETIREIFNASFLIHCALALVVVIVGECVGHWLLYKVLVIPPERLDAAWWVFQFSVISMAVSITQVPYTEVIMAHERMSVYAYLEMLNVALKLLIVYLLSISDFDKLVTYSFLLLVVSTLMAFTYRFYCMRHFPECRLQRVKSYDSVKKMISFSLLDLYGNIGVTVNNQGITYAINIFFGVVYNAAVSLATTVNGMILSLTTTIAIAFKPQIIKRYAADDIQGMQTVMCNSLKFTIIAMAMISVPCAFEADFIMNLWLGEIPVYSTEFLRIIIIFSFLPVINNVCNAAIHATGNIKALTFINGSVFMIMPVTIFLVYHLGASALWGYAVEILGMIFIIAIALGIIKHLISTFRVYTITAVLAKCLAVILLSCIPAAYIHANIPTGFLQAIAVTLAYTAVLAVLSWMCLLTPGNRITVSNKAKSIIKRSIK